MKPFDPHPATDTTERMENKEKISARGQREDNEQARGTR